MAVALREHPLYSDPNLVSYWKLDGNSTDSKGSNNGTDTAITYSIDNGRFDQGAGLNGTSSKITISDSSSLKPTTTFSVMAWVNLTHNGIDYVFCNTILNTNDYTGWILAVEAKKISFYILPTNGTSTVISCIGNTDINDGNWHLIHAVWTGTQMLVYLDGVSDKTPTANTSAPAYDATMQPRIGCGYGNGADTYFFNGKIDEVAFFSRTLTSTEILNYYNYVSGGFYYMSV